MVLAWRERLGRDSLDTDGTVSFKDDLLDLGVANQVKVRVVGSRGVNVSMSGVRSATGVAEVYQYEFMTCDRLAQMPYSPVNPLQPESSSKPDDSYENQVRDTYQCSAPWPVTRSCRSSVTGIS